MTTAYQMDHGGFCRVAISQSRRRTNRFGLDLVRWFFNGQGRHDHVWRSVDMARQINVPLRVCNSSLRLARKAQLVELTAKGWIWIGSES